MYTTSGYYYYCMLQAVTGHALVLEEEQTALKSEHSRAKGEAIIVSTAGNAARNEAIAQLQVGQTLLN
jgi:hypothetical protein